MPSILKRISILIPILGLFWSCQSAQMGDNDSDNSVLTGEELEEYKIFQSLQSKSKALIGGQDLRKDVDLWAYQTGFIWLDGVSFFENKMLEVNIFKQDRAIYIEVDVDLSQLLPLPTVYNSDFNKKEIADKLKLELALKCEGKVIRKLKKEEAIPFDSKTNTAFTITLADLKKLRQGWNEITLELNSELVSFFGVRSRVKPVQAKINFEYFTPSIHHTQIYFNKLILNCEEVMEFLGDNDWNNGTPETGLSIYNGGMHICTEFTKNSCSHLKPFMTDLYHFSDNDSILLKIVDVDYGFNGNDVIVDTMVSLKSLESTTFINIPLKYVETLEMYSVYKGKIN